VNAYTIQYDDGFWQGIKNVINWYDAISPDIGNSFLEGSGLQNQELLITLMLSVKLPIADSEESFSKNLHIKYISG
jgi:hypothetical protein